MRITKEEACILSAAIHEEKYRYIDKIATSKEEAQKYIKVLNRLEEKLDKEASDGRAKQNDLSSVLYRYLNKPFK